LLEDFTNKMCDYQSYSVCVWCLLFMRKTSLQSQGAGIVWTFMKALFFLKKKIPLTVVSIFFFKFRIVSSTSFLLGKFCLIQISFVTCMSRTLTKFCSVLIWSLSCWLMYSQTERVFSPSFVLNCLYQQIVSFHLRSSK